METEPEGETEEIGMSGVMDTFLNVWNSCYIYRYPCRKCRDVADCDHAWDEYNIDESRLGCLGAK